MPTFSNFSIEIFLDGRYSSFINPVRNSSGALNPTGIIPKM
jgi:hypothetical protein